MHVAARVDHAISAALMLPEPTDQPVAGAVLAEQLGISYPYLMTIIEPLKKSGLASVRRGPNGGLSLARPSGEITLADVIWAVDAPLGPAVRPVDESVVGSTSEDLLPRLWSSANQAVFAVFAQVPLARVRTADLSRAVGEQVRYRPKCVEREETS